MRRINPSPRNVKHSRSKANSSAGKRARIWRNIALCLMLAGMVLSMAGCSSLNDESGDGIFSGILGVDSSRSQSVNIMILLTILSLLPSFLIMLTGFTRIIIVLSLLRNGMGLQQMPPNQVIVGLALFLTWFVMAPVFDQVKVNAYDPYIAQEINEDQAIELAMEPIREFMLAQTYGKDLNFFINASAMYNPDAEQIEVNDYSDIPGSVLIPAYIISEIKRGFTIGFYIYIPFIVVDMVVASTLMAMGMMMLPPVVISLPFKILIFVLVDGWSLITEVLLKSFG